MGRSQPALRGIQSFPEDQWIPFAKMNLFFTEFLNRLCYVDLRSGTLRISLFRGVIQRILVLICQMDCLTLEYENDSLSRNVGHYQSRLRNKESRLRAWNYAKGSSFYSTTTATTIIVIIITIIIIIIIIMELQKNSYIRHCTPSKSANVEIQ
jgi:hypothetical protein